MFSKKSHNETRKREKLKTSSTEGQMDNAEAPRIDSSETCATQFNPNQKTISALRNSSYRSSNTKSSMEGSL